jgi:hypothetical protein
VPDVVHRDFVLSRAVYQVLRKQLFAGYGMVTPAEPTSRLKRLVEKP